jgi:hypothetical protein
MPKLTDAQLVILSAAAARGDRAVLPFPKSLRMNKGALTACINSLIKPGLIAEQPAVPGTEAWRQTEDKRFGLVLTEKGLRAINAQEPDGRAPQEPEAKTETARKPHTSAEKNATKRSASKPAAPRPESKLSLLQTLLSRKNGATIDEATKATGWQAHSVRGAISGTFKKKLGLRVTSEVTDRGRVYRIAGGR